MPRMDKLGSTATSIKTENGMTSIRYHDTDVVVYDNTKIILDSGGWLTTTTKTRMNQASTQFDLGYSVTQVKRKWYVFYRGKTIPFSDGMVLDRQTTLG